eukprot:CAMPEP_0115248848 /NCGR_PEP_ID=MMETSP0270-20121206/42281_1 /TAXON_ID=71861 /ORGANISM="Scrippsiella trochoidea, Strain CCMP3099" /LENGTH=54 /DNA_ID=CAMNT_0002664161 /DNA_START=1402 /DNA_END=1566 /DNA_ORIENTATION=-
MTGLMPLIAPNPANRAMCKLVQKIIIRHEEDMRVAALRATKALAQVGCPKSTRI